MKINCGPFGNVEMEAKVSRFAAKNWLYVDFGKKSRACIDLGTGELVKGQCHSNPVLAKEEIKRIVNEFNKEN